MLTEHHYSPNSAVLLMFSELFIMGEDHNPTNVSCPAIVQWGLDNG
jgi:hypothetical protein